MKMVDAWLLFNLLYPFIVVLLHTYMDTLRRDEDKEVNQHERAITINQNEDNGNILKVGICYKVNIILKSKWGEKAHFFVP